MRICRRSQAQSRTGQSTLAALTPDGTTAPTVRLLPAIPEYRGRRKHAGSVRSQEFTGAMTDPVLQTEPKVKDELNSVTAIDDERGWTASQLDVEHGINNR